MLFWDRKVTAASWLRAIHLLQWEDGQELDYRCAPQLSEKSLSWKWIIEIENTSHDTVDIDLICVQDVGLKPVSSGLINEYYVSQYLERRILEDKDHGSVVCCRQNMKELSAIPG